VRCTWFRDQVVLCGTCHTTKICHGFTMISLPLVYIRISYKWSLFYLQAITCHFSSPISRACRQWTALIRRISELTGSGSDSTHQKSRLYISISLPWQLRFNGWCRVVKLKVKQRRGVEHNWFLTSVLERGGTLFSVN